MITNKGSSIITRYLLGQAPDYAAYLALGVGAQPLDIDEYDSSDQSKDSMEFEAFRVPVTSRGLVNDIVTLDLDSWSSDGTTATITTSTSHGVRIGEDVQVEFSSPSMTQHEGTFTALSTTSDTISYSYSSSGSWSTVGTDTGTVSYSRERIIFKGQLPVDQYYKMTEIAIYPAATNNLAQQFDSKTIAGFLPSEQWKIIIDSSENNLFSVSSNIADSSGDINNFSNPDGSSASAVYINSDNIAFGLYNRKQRYEGARLYNSALMIAGDATSFTDDNLNVSSSTNYISTDSISINLSKNSPNDYIKMAINVVSKNYAESSAPYKTRVRIDFIDSATNGKATAKQIISSSDLSDSRYYVIKKQIKDFVLDENFSWSRVSQIRIYAETLDILDNPLNDFIIFDGIRLDNTNTVNPLYGMISYSRLKNQYEYSMPVEKLENSQGYVEYRIGINII